MPIPAILAAGLTALGTGAAAAGGAAAANKIANKIHQRISQGGKKSKNKGIVPAPVAVNPGSSSAVNALKENLLGTPNRVQQFQNLTPNQQAGQDLILKQALAQLGSNQFDFGPIEQLANNNFARKTIPTIAERFGGSALNRQLATAGVDLNTQLAALRSSHALGQQGLNQNLLQLGLRPQFENAFFGGTPGGLDAFANQAFTGQNFNNLYEFLKNAWSKRQPQNTSSDIEGNPNQVPLGDFAQNDQLQNFVNQANQGISTSSPNLNGFNLLYGQNPIAGPAVPSPLDFSTPGAKPTSLDALKLLYPQAKL
jgi:hypothetical protein